MQIFTICENYMRCVRTYLICDVFLFKHPITRSDLNSLIGVHQGDLTVEQVSRSMLNSVVAGSYTLHVLDRCYRCMFLIEDFV